MMNTWKDFFVVLGMMLVFFGITIILFCGIDYITHDSRTVVSSDSVVRALTNGFLLIESGEMAQVGGLTGIVFRVVPVTGQVTWTNVGVR